MNYINNGSKSLSFENTRDIYNSRVSFKRSMKYLIDSKYVSSQRIRYNKTVYSLTITGELLARLLCNLCDLPDEVRSLKWKLLW